MLLAVWIYDGMHCSGMAASQSTCSFQVGKVLHSKPITKVLMQHITIRAAQTIGSRLVVDRCLVLDLVCPNPFTVARMGTDELALQFIVAACTAAGLVINLRICSLAMFCVF